MASLPVEVSFDAILFTKELEVIHAPKVPSSEARSLLRIPPLACEDVVGFGSNSPSDDGLLPPGQIEPFAMASFNNFKLIDENGFAFGPWLDFQSQPTQVVEERPSISLGHEGAAPQIVIEQRRRIRNLEGRVRQATLNTVEPDNDGEPLDYNSHKLLLLVLPG